MTKIWCNFPVILCPNCGDSAQIDDYYDLEVDDSFYCPKCEIELHIIAKEIIIEVELSTEQKNVSSEGGGKPNG